MMTMTGKGHSGVTGARRTPGQACAHTCRGSQRPGFFLVFSVLGSLSSGFLLVHLPP